jgi:hypothetical protein
MVGGGDISITYNSCSLITPAEQPVVMPAKGKGVIRNSSSFGPADDILL